MVGERERRAQRSLIDLDVVQRTDVAAFLALPYGKVAASAQSHRVNV